MGRSRYDSQQSTFCLLFMHYEFMTISKSHAHAFKLCDVNNSMLKNVYWIYCVT